MPPGVITECLRTTTAEQMSFYKPSPYLDNTTIKSDTSHIDISEALHLSQKA